MPINLNQRGIAHILAVLIILIGIFVGIYLIKNPQIFKSRALNNQTRVEFVDSNGQPISQTTNTQVYLQLTFVPRLSSVVQDNLQTNNTSYDLGVLVLKYFPLTPNGQNIDISVTGDVGNSYSSIRQRTVNITNSLLNTLPKATTYLNSGSPALNYHVVDTKEYTEAVPIKPLPGSEPTYPDYQSVMTANNICDYVDNRQVREVWLFAYQGSGGPPTGSGNNYASLSISESKMAGPYGDISNSARYNDMPICSHTYRVYTFNYAVGAPEALHSWSHQMEAELNAIDSHLFWDLWVGPSHAGANNVTGRCGWTHDPPNAHGDYDYWNSNPNQSDCLDWNPDGLGSLSPISCQNWSCQDQVADPDGIGTAQFNYLVWMWQHLPGRNNTKSYQGLRLRNWWDIHGDWDNIMGSQSQKRLTLSGTLQSPAPQFLPTSFRIANSEANLASAQEQSFDSNGQRISWILPSGNGQRTVFAQFKVNGSWENPVSASIDLNIPQATQAPAVTASPSSSRTAASPTPRPATSATSSPTPASTSTPSPSPTPTATPTPSPTATPAPSPTPTSSPAASNQTIFQPHVETYAPNNPQPRQQITTPTTRPLPTRPPQTTNIISVPDQKSLTNLLNPSLAPSNTISKEQSLINLSIQWVNSARNFVFNLANQIFQLGKQIIIPPKVDTKLEL